MRNLIRVLVVLAVLGAGFYGWKLWTRDNGDGAGSSAELTPETAEQLGAEIGRQIGQEVGTRIGEETVARLELDSGDGTTIAAAEPAGEPPSAPTDSEPAPAPTPEPAPPPPAPAAAPTPEPAPAPPPVAAAPEPAPEPAPATPAEPSAAAPTPEPSAAPPTETAAAEPSPTAEAEEPKKNLPAPEPERPRAPLPSLTAWWAESANTRLPITSIGTAKSSDDKLGLVVILLNGSFDGGSNPGQHIKLTTLEGQPAGGDWTVGSNAKMLTTFGLDIGRYNLSLGAGLADSAGNKLDKELSGQIDVR